MASTVRYREYRGWMINSTFVAYRSGTTIYGDSLKDVKRRIDAFMNPRNWK